MKNPNIKFMIAFPLLVSMVIVVILLFRLKFADPDMASTRFIVTYWGELLLAGLFLNGGRFIIKKVYEK